MKNTLVVVTDLGLLKAYRLEKTRLNTPRLVLLEEFRADDAHGKLSDKLSDQAGRYRVPTSTMAMSGGESQRINLEFRKRLVKQLGENLKRILDDPQIEDCYLAASIEINKPLLSDLSGNLRAKIVKNIPADLTKLDKSELLGHFLKESPTAA